jgi:hypothetical protein
MEWTRVTDPDETPRLFPAWFSSRLIGTRGAFGPLLATGDVMRITSVMALHHASDGTVLVDILLDHAGPPEGVDVAWCMKHFLEAPVPGATIATVNLTHVVRAVEFVVAEIVEPALGLAGALGDELPENVIGLGPVTPPAIMAAG